MTRSHSRAPLRRSSAPERILSAGLATAACVGVVGLLGARTIEANTTSSSTDPAPASTEVVPVATVEPTTASGLTEADLDSYAAALAAEKERLDEYRAKLVRTAKKLKKQAAAQQKAASSANTYSVPSSSGGSSNSGSSNNNSSNSGSNSGGSQAAAPAKPAPKPQAAAAPAPAPAPQAQSNTTGS